MAQFAPTDTQLTSYGFTQFTEGPPMHPSIIWKKTTYDNTLQENGVVAYRPGTTKWYLQIQIGGAASAIELNVETEAEILTSLKVLEIPA